MSYLSPESGLPADLADLARRGSLTPADEKLLDVFLSHSRAQIRRERRSHEQQTGELVHVEPPAEPLDD